MTGQRLFFTYMIIILSYRLENTLLKETEILSARIKRIKIIYFIFLSKKCILILNYSHMKRLYILFNLLFLFSIAVTVKARISHHRNYSNHLADTLSNDI